MCRQTCFCVDTSSLALSYFGRVLASSPACHLCASEDPRYRSRGLHLDLFLRKWPSYHWQFQFCRCWQHDRLEEVDFKVQYWLFPRHKPQLHQSSKYPQLLPSLYFHRKWWQKVSNMQLHAHTLLLELFLYSSWSPKRLCRSMSKNLVDKGCRLQVILLPRLHQRHRKSGPLTKNYALLDSWVESRDFIVFSTWGDYSHRDRYLL